MSAIHEIVVPPDNFPAIIIIHSPKNTSVCKLHWHESIELLASLDSRLHITCGQKQFNLMENDVALINSSMIHSVAPLEGHAIVSLSIRLDPGLFKNYSNEKYNWFDLEQNLEAKQDIIICCRKLYELYTYEKGNTGLLLEANALIFHIVYLMITHLCVSHLDYSRDRSEKYHDRYRKIIAYMEEHYNDSLPLNEISEMLHLSKEHLSREFRSYVGEGFREHLTNIRLVKAHKDLLGSDLPLLDIALEHGFPNLRAYNQAFQKIYHVSPAQYRRNYKRQKEG